MENLQKSEKKKQDEQ